MSLRRHDRLLDQMLDHLAGSSIVKDPEHRDALAAAATAIRAIFAVPGFETQCRILITTGWDADPLVSEVENAAEDIDRMRDDLAVLGDRLDDIARQLKKPATPSAPTAGATA